MIGPPMLYLPALLGGMQVLSETAAMHGIYCLCREHDTLHSIQQ